jgi:hypothetical protein
VIWKYFGEAIFRLNLVPGVSIPRNKSIGARKGFVHLMLQTMVNLYRSSNQSHIIGGEVTSLGIDHDGYLA